MIHHLDYGHFTSEGVIDVGEFSPYVPPSYDDDRIGDLPGEYRLVARHYLFAVDLETRQRHWDRARGYQYLSGIDLYLAFFLYDSDLVFRDHSAYAFEQHRLVFLEKEFDAFRQCISRIPALVYDPGEVISKPFMLYTELSGMFEVLVDLGAFEYGFGRDAAPVEADASGPVSFADCHLPAELRRPYCGYVAARSRSYHCQVKFFHGRCIIYSIERASIVSGGGDEGLPRFALHFGKKTKKRPRCFSSFP